MFEQLAIEQTPVAVQIYTQSYFESPKTSRPVQDRRAQVPSRTSPRTLVVPIVAEKVDSTATLADISERRRQQPALSQDGSRSGPEAIIDRTRNDRVTLLARKYAGKIDSEGSARLEILTERLNRLSPPIEAAAIDRVAEVVAIAAKSNSRLAGLKAKYKV